MKGNLVSFIRRMSYFVNRCTQRIELLRELSAMITRFTSCDAIAIRARDHELYYHWEASFYPEESYSIVNVPFSIEDGRLVHTAKAASALDDLMNIMVSSAPNPDPPLVSRNGSLFCNHTAEPVRLRFHSDVSDSDRMVTLGGRYRSVGIVRFMIDDNECLLVYLHRQPGFFKPGTTEALELIAQNLGIAASEFRAKVKLRERVKEITCLHDIAHIAMLPNLSTDELLERIVNTLPDAWQFSQSASATVCMGEDSYSSGTAREGGPQLSRPIIVSGRECGSVTVRYDPDLPKYVDAFFLPEEEKLITAVASEISMILTQRAEAAARERVTEQLRHAERLSTVGQFAAGVAHQLNEPLACILGYAQLITKSKVADKRVLSDAGKIINASLNARDTVKKLLAFARQTPFEKEPTDLNSVFDYALVFIEPRCRTAGISIDKQLASGLPRIMADPSQLIQMVVNLTVNAVQAMPDGGTLTLTTRAENGSVLLSVSDTGMGMDDEIIQNIFLPFYTTKPVGEGTGLGLSLVHGIVSMHGGEISVSSVPGRGSRFEVRLPKK